MARDTHHDPRLDPRIKAILAMIPPTEASDVANREEILAEAQSPEGLAAAEAWRQLAEALDSEEMAPPAELGIDPDHVVIAGESGGGNLTLATGLSLLRSGQISG